MNPEPTSPSFGWRNLSYLTSILVLLAVISFIAVAEPDGSYYHPMPVYMEGGYLYDTKTSGAPASPGGGSERSSGDMSVSYPYPYQDPTAPATDTREFLKINYGAEMLTRDVSALTRRVLTTVRGYDGRIDHESSSPKYGYVSFVLPASKYEAFRSELESLVASRFLSVNVSSENLLPQKLSIEEQQKQADDALASYQAARTSVVSAHTNRLAALRADLDKAVAESAHTSVIDSIQASIDAENVAYAKKLAAADANITYAKDWQKAIETKDEAFLANVETVNGTVSLRWIGLWELAQLYLPGYWIPAIFAVLAFLSGLRDRRRFRRAHA